MRKISQQEATRRAVSIDQGKARQALALKHEDSRSVLFRLLDDEFEAIAACRPDRSRWDPVLRWLGQCGVTEAQGRPLTAASLAVAWHRVRMVRAARGLQGHRAIPGDRNHQASLRGPGIDVQADGRNSEQGQYEEGQAEMPTTKGTGSSRPSFSGHFAAALEEADRHSQLYLFLRENYDAIVAHRPRFGGWHRFLAVLNETGILDGEGRVVTQRVLTRTWHKVSKAATVERSRPAARAFFTSPDRLQTPSAPPQNETASSTAGPLSPRSDRPPAAAIRPQSQFSYPPSTSEAGDSLTPLTQKQAWMIQNLRNEYLESAGFPPATTLDHDLVMRLCEEALPTCIALV